MPQLLFDLDIKNETASILERNVITSHNEQDTPIQELEKTLEEATSDLALNKALHLLLHVHGHVFDKAVTSITETTSSGELLIKKTESPTVRAILSMDNYLSQHNNNTFQQIYDPLKEKFLKRTPSIPAMRIISYFVLHSHAHHQQAREYLIKQLSMEDDKRSQLAAVVLLQFVFKHYIVLMSNNQVCRVFLDALVALVSRRSSSPTLLPCSACTLALQLLQLVITHPENHATVDAQTDSTKIIEITDNEPIQDPLLEPSVQTNISTLLDVLEKWYTPKDDLTAATYTYLRQHIRQTDDAIVFQYLTPATVLSPKPISIRQQIQLLSAPSSLVLMLWILLQKGQFTTNTGRVIVSVEEEQILQQVYNLFESTSSQYIDDVWMPQLVMAMPQLSTHINSTQLVEAVLERCSSIDDLSWIIPMIMRLQDKESCICRLIWYILSDNAKAKFAYSVLSQLIQQNVEEIILLMEDNLLPVAKQSNQACELLIQCMPYSRLPWLIQKLMKMVINANDIEKEKIPYIALISKALLQEPWASNSILLYIDWVRDFKVLGGFVPGTRSPPLTPQNITQFEVFVENPFTGKELETQSTWLMGPIQLWATKVGTNIFVSALRQLVRYSYGLPQDTTCIDAWRHLSFAFAKDHTLVWPVIEECLDIMQSQIRFTEELVHTATALLKKEILFLSLSPMLILQTIPKEAFDVVQLPKSYTDLISQKLESIGIEPHELKISSNHTQTSIHLFQVLLQRCFEKDQEVQIPIDFTVSLLTKIFCK